MTTRYHYPATDEERAAAALLKEHGWDVSEPRCPDCNGWGFIGDSWYTPVDAELGIGSGGVSTKPCPNGCPMPAVYV